MKKRRNREIEVNSICLNNDKGEQDIGKIEQAYMEARETLKDMYEIVLPGWNLVYPEYAINSFEEIEDELKDIGILQCWQTHLFTVLNLMGPINILKKADILPEELIAQTTFNAYEQPLLLIATNRKAKKLMALLNESMATKEASR